MRELQLVLSDDLAYAQGERIPAEETVVIAIDGKTRELDLTAAHAKELREMLAPYIDAGHVPGNQPSRAAVKPPVDVIQSRARQKQLRDWADRKGLRSEDGLRPIYRTPGGGYYYPHDMVKQYEAEQKRSGTTQEKFNQRIMDEHDTP